MKYQIRQRNFVLLASTILCIVLLIIRITVSGNISYSFLAWNLFLAWIPLYFSNLFKTQPIKTSNWTSYFVFVSWLVFFPNAPYLITDLIHLRPKTGVPLWFDLILLITYSWHGLLLAHASLSEIHQKLLLHFSVRKTVALLVGILFLSGYGIYLGRFERWNSWDLLTNPFKLFQNMVSQLIHLDTFMHIAAVSLSFGIFFSLLYFSVHYLKSTNEIN